MSTNFTSTELFGGAIVVDLPEGWLDASTIRQIPDHQEVYLSPTSNTSIVVEINERVTPETTASIDSPTASGSGDAGNKKDRDALLYHLKDLVESTPERSQSSSTTESNQTSIKLQPTPVSLTKLGDSTPAYILSAASTDTITNHSDPERSTRKETMIFLLMVRLERQETDLLVALNSPLTGDEGAGANRQEGNRWAKEVLDKIAGSLEIKDWGLFGEDEA